MQPTKVLHIEWSANPPSPYSHALMLEDLILPPTITSFELSVPRLTLFHLHAIQDHSHIRNLEVHSKEPIPLDSSYLLCTIMQHGWHSYRKSQNELMITPDNYVEGIRGPFKQKVFEVDGLKEDSDMEQLVVQDYSTEKLRVAFPSKLPIKDWRMLQSIPLVFKTCKRLKSLTLEISTVDISRKDKILILDQLKSMPSNALQDLTMTFKHMGPAI